MKFFARVQFFNLKIVEGDAAGSYFYEFEGYIFLYDGDAIRWCLKSLRRYFCFGRFMYVVRA